MLSGLSGYRGRFLFGLQCVVALQCIHVDCRRKAARAGPAMRDAARAGPVMQGRARSGQRGARGTVLRSFARVHGVVAIYWSGCCGVLSGPSSGSHMASDTSWTTTRLKRGTIGKPMSSSVGCTDVTNCLMARAPVSAWRVMQHRFARAIAVRTCRLGRRQGQGPYAAVARLCLRVRLRALRVRLREATQIRDMQDLLTMAGPVCDIALVCRQRQGL